MRAIAIVPGTLLKPLPDSFLIFPFCPSDLFPHAGVKPAPLDHESRDDAVKDQVVVEPVIDVLQEILDRDRGFFLIELDRDRAERRVKDHDRVLVVTLGRDGPIRQSMHRRPRPSDDHYDESDSCFVLLPWLRKAPSRQRCCCQVTSGQENTGNPGTRFRSLETAD